MKTVQLLKSWTDPSKAIHEAGTCLEMDDDTAKEVVTKKFGEYVGAETASEDGTADPVLDVPLNAATVQKMIADAVKAASRTPTNPRPPIRVVKENVVDDPKLGYRDGADFLTDIVLAGTPNREASPRLKMCDPRVRGKAVGSDEYATVEDAIGGFFIPPELRPELLTKGVETDWVRGNGAMVLPVSGTMLSINAEVDKNRQTTLFGGITVYFQSERAQMTMAKGEFEQIELKPKMLTGMFPATDNLLQNVPAMTAIIARQFGDAMVYKQLEKFVAGKGGGEPLGFMNSSAKYEQAKEAGQTAATIVTNNVLKMVSRMRAQDRKQAVWLATPESLPQIMTLSLAVGTGGAPLMLFNIADDGTERLYGRPIIFTEHSQALGTVGDLVLASFPHYLIGETDYRRSDSSIHLRFDYNETVFRFVMTVDAQPWWRSTLTLKNGFEVAPFITLATRA